MVFKSTLGALLLVTSMTGFADGKHKIIKATSEKGRSLTLDFAPEKVTKANKEALFCSNPGVKASSAKLWMPEHGHGSTPTKLVEKENSCTNIEKINFTMTGEWEIRVVLEDDDKGVFTVDVEE